YSIICVERNPYEKVVSLANWMLRAPEYSRGQVIGFDPAQTRAVVDLLINDGRILLTRNIDLYRRSDGRLDVKLLRYETLAEDFENLMASLNVPRPWPVLPHAK